jgi:CRISPR-associated RAMP protein (TIGR02581 family)
MSDYAVKVKFSAQKGGFPMFEKFESRVILSGTLTTCTALHIGSTYGRAIGERDTDSPVIKDANDKPLIPGSSFKGALRSTLERLVAGLNSKKVRSCYITSPNIPIKAPGCLSVLSKEDLEEAKAKFQDEELQDEEYLTMWYQEGSCAVCNLLGSTHLSSKVFIKDLLCKTGDRSSYQVRDGVAIDRDSDTAVDRLKYDFEVVYPGTQFGFQAVAENATKEQLGLFLIGLRQFEGATIEGTQERLPGRAPLGGRKSRGLGWVDLVLDRIEIIDETRKFTEAEDALLLNYLLNNRGHILERPKTPKGKKSSKTEAEQDVVEKFVQDMIQAFLNSL